MVLASVCVAVCGCQQSIPPEIIDSEIRVVRVPTIQLEKVDNVVKYSVYFGKLQPHRQISLGFSKPGTVENVYAKIGQTVSKDEILAQLSQPDLLQQKAVIEERQKLESESSRRTQNASQLASINAELQRGIIVAPFDGLVVENRINQGGAVPAGQPLIKIFDTKTPNIQFDLPRRLLPRSLASLVNSPKTINVLTDGQTVETRVRFLSPVEQASSNIRMTLVCLEDKRPTWNFGQTVEIAFEDKTDESGFWIPTESLARGEAGSWSVLRVAADSNEKFSVEQVVVEVSQTNGEYALINGPLVSKDQIISKGLHRIVSGQRVIPVPVPSVANLQSAESAE